MATVAIVVVVLVVVVVTLVSERRRKERVGPRAYWRRSRRVFYVVAVLQAMVIATSVWFAMVSAKQGSSELLWQALLGVAFFAAIFVWVASDFLPRQTTDWEAMHNYDADPQHCGRCAYDLTGNESGRCPECGWTIPASDHPRERTEWVCWWRSWRIDHLYDWRHTLRDTIVVAGGLAFAVACLLWVVQDRIWWWWAVFLPAAGLVVAHMAITLYRIIDYGRREQRESLAYRSDSDIAAGAGQSAASRTVCESNGGPHAHGKGINGEEAPFADDVDRPADRAR